MILTCIWRAIAHKGHIFMFPWVAFIIQVWLYFTLPYVDSACSSCLGSIGNLNSLKGITLEWYSKSIWPSIYKNVVLLTSIKIITQKEFGSDRGSQERLITCLLTVVHIGLKATHLKGANSYLYAVQNAIQKGHTYNIFMSEWAIAGLPQLINFSATCISWWEQHTKLLLQGLCNSGNVQLANDNWVENKSTIKIKLEIYM